MPYNDATLNYLDRCIEEEAGKVQAGGSGDKLENLKQYRKEYEQEINHLEEYMKKGTEELLLDQAAVDLMMKDVYSLKHYGSMLSDMCNVIQNLLSGADRERAHMLRAKDHWEHPKKHRRSNKASMQDRPGPTPGQVPFLASKYDTTGQQPGIVKRFTQWLTPWKF